MPRHPHTAGSVARIGGSLFSKLAHRLRTYEGEIYPLHVGDTWMEPPAGCRMEDLSEEEHPGMHRYCPPHGHPALLEVIVERVAGRSGLEVEPDHVLVTTGATGGLGAVVGAVIDPGEEVLILSPYWPLIAGIVRCYDAEPVEVPFFGAVDSPETVVEAVEERLGPRTAALWLNTPNNPTGRIIPRPWLEALAEWARSRDLWILADEVYEDYVFDGEHAWARPLAPERTFSAHSFSKAYGMAGNRCGYVVGPAETMAEVRKIGVHAYYSAPTASQLAGARALGGAGDAWVERARDLYRDLGTRAADRLGLPRPEGSQFLFFDVADALDERGLMGFLEDCVERGLFVAPGPSFGDYPTSVRVCYTAAEPEVVERGVGTLAELLGR